MIASVCITFELELVMNDYIILPFYEGKKCGKMARELKWNWVVNKSGFQYRALFFLDEKCKTIFQGEYSLSSLYLDNDTLWFFF